MPSLNFSQDTGMFALDAPGFTANGGIFRIHTDTFRLASNKISWRKQNGRFTTKISDAQIRIRTTPDGFRVMVKNTSGSAFHLASMVLSFAHDTFSPFLAAEQCTQLVREKVPMEGSGVYRVDREPVTGMNGQSYGMTVLHNTSISSALLLGVLGKTDCLVSFSATHDKAHKQGSFGMDVRFEFNCHVPGGAEISTPMLFVKSGDDPLDLLENYGRQWKKAVPPRKTARTLGWNSWDYYGGSVSHDDAMENCRAMQRHFPALNTCIVDDGWQVRWGEWEAHNRFPKGIRGLARDISRTGFRPGVWIAPFTEYMHNPFVRKHRDCLVHDRNGDPVRMIYSSGPVVLLDPSHPRAARKIRRDFLELRRAGISWYKLDFNQALLEVDDPVFHDKTMTVMQVMRRGLEIIRTAVGKEAFISSGCFPFEVLAGLADAARIANDIHTRWGHVRNNAMQIAASYWMHGNLFNVDPDFLIVRTETTCRDRHFNYINWPAPVSRSKFFNLGRNTNENELQVWATIVALCGGEIISSDRLSTLNRKGRDMVHTVLDNLSDIPARPVDLFDNAMIGRPPSLWAGSRNGRPLAGLINWESVPRRIPVDPSILGIGEQPMRDLWTGKTVIPGPGTFIDINAHSAVFLISSE